MQEYGKTFAEVYSKKWTQFSAFIAPKIRAYYEITQMHANNKLILDLCCGTGQLCNYFIQHGYSVAGVDCSEYMLKHARELNAPYINSGKAEFIQADVAEYAPTRKYGLIVSMYDSLNHLDSMPQLTKCFVQTKKALSLGGQFIFDLNTAEGLKRWVGIDIQEDEEITLIRRGIYEIGMEKAYTQISGYIRRQNNLFERFNEVFYNTVFDLSEVQNALQAAGFNSNRIVSATNFEEILDHPEKEGRVVFIAQH